MQVITTGNAHWRNMFVNITETQAFTVGSQFCKRHTIIREDGYNECLLSAPRGCLKIKFKIQLSLPK